MGDSNRKRRCSGIRLGKGPEFDSDGDVFYLITC